MTSPTDPNYDPLDAYESVPAISFDPSRGGLAEGEFAELVVTDYITLVQAKDENKNPKVWPDTGKPVMKFVLPVQMNGEARALWGDVIRMYDTALFAQLIAAQRQVKAQSGDPSRRLGPGCTIKVAWAWNTAVPKKLGNHPKKYKVELVSVGTPPPTGADPLGEPVAAGVGAGRSSDPWGSTGGAAQEPPFLHRIGFDAKPDALTV